MELLPTLQNGHGYRTDLVNIWIYSAHPKCAIDVKDSCLWPAESMFPIHPHWPHDIIYDKALVRTWICPAHMIGKMVSYIWFSLWFALGWIGCYSYQCQLRLHVICGVINVCIVRNSFDANDTGWNNTKKIYNQLKLCDAHTTTRNADLLIGPVGTTFNNIRISKVLPSAKHGLFSNHKNVNVCLCGNTPCDTSYQLFQRCFEETNMWAYIFYPSSALGRLIHFALKRETYGTAS